MSGVVSSASYRSSGSAKLCPFSVAHAGGVSHACSWSAQGDDVVHAQARGVGRFVIGLLLTEPFGFHPGQVVLDFAFALRIAPAKDFSHQLSDYRARGHTAVPRLDGNPGAAGQDIVDMAGALVGGCVDSFCGQVVIGTRQRLGQFRAVRR